MKKKGKKRYKGKVIPGLSYTKRREDVLVRGVIAPPFSLSLLDRG
jgi:hypothetical protein